MPLPKITEPTPRTNASVPPPRTGFGLRPCCEADHEAHQIAGLAKLSPLVWLYRRQLLRGRVGTKEATHRAITPTKRQTRSRICSLGASSASMRIRLGSLSPMSSISCGCPQKGTNAHVVWDLSASSRNRRSCRQQTE